MLFLGLRDFERGGAVIESGWNGAEEDLGSGRLRGFPLCGLSNLLFRHAVKGLCHGGIEPYGSVGEPLEQDFQSLRFAVSPGVHVREHLRESIPSPVPLSVILVFVEQKGFLEPV